MNKQAACQQPWRLCIESVLDIPLTMVVFALPPSESCKRRVSFESRYGMCVLFPSTCVQQTRAGRKIGEPF